MLWYVARAGGLLSLTLLSAVVVLGISTRAGWATSRTPRAYVTLVHRYLSLLALVFLGVHVTTVVIDGYVDVSWIDALVPFRTPYRTVWLAAGTIAVDLMLAVVVTSLLRQRIPLRAWRSLHLSACGVWALAFGHALGAGTDRAVVLALGGLCAIAIVASLLVAASRSQRPPAPSAAPPRREQVSA